MASCTSYVLLRSLGGVGLRPCVGYIKVDGVHVTERSVLSLFASYEIYIKTSESRTTISCVLSVILPSRKLQATVG